MQTEIHVTLASLLTHPLFFPPLLFTGCLSVKETAPCNEALDIAIVDLNRRCVKTPSFDVALLLYNLDLSRICIFKRL